MIKNRFKITIYLYLLITFTFPIFAFENTILFKINNTSFTQLDVEERKKYLIFVGNNYNLKDEFILDDLSSTILFYEFFKNNNSDYNDIKLQSEKIFEDVNNKNSNFFNKNKISKESILKNITYDLARKLVVEELFERKRNSFNISKNANNIYNFNIKYLNITIEEISKLENNFKKINFKNLNELILILKNENISYFLKEKKVNDISNIDNKIKNNINNKNYFFKLTENNLITFIEIEKNFITYEGLYTEIYSIETNKKINDTLVKCNNIKELSVEYNVISKVYEFTKLNQQIKNKLIEVDDYILFENEDKITYVILCNIQYDKEFFTNININNNVIDIVEEIENDFIKKYSNEYKLTFYNE